MLFSSQVVTSKASALSMSGFESICNSRPVKCKDHPILQAYVGGALDLVATLDEKTNYLEPFFCKTTASLYDVNKIITFMELHYDDYRDQNAMLVLVKYLKQHGRCE